MDVAFSSSENEALACLRELIISILSKVGTILGNPGLILLLKVPCLKCLYQTYE